jgi:hypothetical protein
MTRALKSIRATRSLIFMIGRSPLRISCFSRRRAALGLALVVHLLWLSLATMPNMAAAAAAPAAAVHCHELQHAATHAPTPAPTGSAHHVPPCCAQQCQCVGGLCAVLSIAVNRAPLAPTGAVTLEYSTAAPVDAAMDRQFRPPISA